MSSIIVDLSPMLINRTAVFHMGQDILKVMENSGQFEIHYRFFGQAEPDWPDNEAAANLIQGLGNLRAAAAEDRLRDWSPLGRYGASGAGTAAERAFLLDPLYALFAPLAREDIIILHDLSTLTHPEWHDPVVSRMYQEAFRRILEVAPELMMVSQNTADTFFANFGAYPNRTTVVSLYPSGAIAEAAFERSTPGYRSTSPYFLFVGSLEVRKNVTGAIDAFAASDLARDGYRLLLVGGIGHGGAAIERRAREVPGVVVSGYRSDDELCSVYAGATGFLYPSYLEGFGVPLLEAMSFGLPCVATTSGASPEVGGPLVRYRDPDDHLGMARDLRAITRLHPGERTQIATGLRERVRSNFSFEQFSSRLLAMLRPEPVRQ